MRHAGLRPLLGFRRHMSAATRRRPLNRSWIEVAGRGKNKSDHDQDDQNRRQDRVPRLPVSHVVAVPLAPPRPNAVLGPPGHVRRRPCCSAQGKNSRERQPDEGELDDDQRRKDGPTAPLEQSDCFKQRDGRARRDSPGAHPPPLPANASHRTQTERRLVARLLMGWCRVGRNDGSIPRASAGTEDSLRAWFLPTAEPHGDLGVLALSSAHCVPVPTARFTRKASIALLLSLAGWVQAAAGQAAQHPVTEAINDALRATWRVDPECRPSPHRTRPVVVDGGAGPQVTAAIAAFRRPATELERVELASRFQGDNGLLLEPFFATVGREGARVVHAANGTALVLISAQTTRQLGLPRAAYDRCAASTRELLRRRAPKIVRARALRTFARLVLRGRPAASPPILEGLDLATETDGGGGPFDPRHFATHGMTETFYSPTGTSITGLFPDGVARVRFDYPRTAKHRAYRIEATIRENVVVVRNPVPTGFPEQTVWYGEHREVLRVVHR